MAAHQAEVIEHIEGLGADRFALARNQIPLADVNRRDALFGELFFDQLLAQVGVSAEVAAPLKAAHQHLDRQGLGGVRRHGLALQLQGCCLLQLCHREAADQSLTQHPFRRLSHLVVPGQPLLIAALL